MKTKFIFSFIFIIVIFILGFTFKNKNEENYDLSIMKIDLLNCSVYDLIEIPGIGESKAKNIIEYRNSHGFTKKEDILNVSGIGPSIYNKIKNYIYVSEKIIKIENKKININKANISELESLPGIGKTTAKKIINYRKYKKINDFEDLYNIGINRNVLNNLEGMIEF
jgi:competence protein ComEA